jgi:hypothetical protein
MTEMGMAGDRISIMETSKDSKELLKTACTFAQSSESIDHELLLRFLRSQDFLQRLDSESDYAAEIRLRIRRVLDELAKNQNPSARNILVALTQDQTFLMEPARVDRLIQACAVIRPLPPEVIKFWDDHCQPEDGFTPLTIEAIIENGSEPALTLLEQKMLDPRQMEQDIIAWMHTNILIHRNDLPLLRSCERMLAGGLPEKLRLALGDVLFDYRPTEWFPDNIEIRPPDRRQAGSEALAQLRKIGEYALKNILMKARLRKAVMDTLEEIKKIQE